MNAFINTNDGFSDLELKECGREICIPNKVFHFTSKTYYLVHYIIDGEGSLSLNGKNYHLKKGMAFFFEPFSEPEYHPDQKNPWTYVWIGFTGNQVKGMLDSLGIDGFNPIYFDGEGTLANYFEMIYHRFQERGIIDISCIGIFYQVLGDMLYRKERLLEEVSKPKRHIVAAITFIANNYQFKISIEDIANNVGVTPNYLAGLFKDTYGISVKRFLTEYRMDKAKLLLRNGAYNVKAVAKLVGYDNQLHFSGEFKKNVGVAPMEYIKENLS
ncbi:MAG TPA: AraC family transcriptional regulator [Bacilli bacterium]|nr:AraC family transcriptional regulator [Bacilli bacterium]